MKIIYGINKIKKLRNPVVAMGVFDGVHRGHREILQAAAVKARTIKGTSVVLTFWPHPQKKASLYSLEHRLRLIEELGIDATIVITFNPRFARISAADFVRDILVKKIGAHSVYVGENFRFGRNAEGDFRTLRSLAGVFNFGLKIFKVLKINGRPISSTYIRNLIKRGDLQEAKNLLGRPVSILGTVIKGTALGRILGIPTANIDPHHEVIPPCGVYAVRIIYKKRRLKGVCYIGRRPTLKLRNNRVNVEAHIFDFKRNIYSEFLEIQFAKKIREDKKFPSLAALTQQMKRDLIFARDILSRH